MEFFYILVVSYTINNTRLGDYAEHNSYLLFETAAHCEKALRSLDQFYDLIHENYSDTMLVCQQTGMASKSIRPKLRP